METFNERFPVYCYRVNSDAAGWQNHRFACKSSVFFWNSADHGEPVKVRANSGGLVNYCGGCGGRKPPRAAANLPFQKKIPGMKKSSPEMLLSLISTWDQQLIKTGKQS